MRPTSRVIEETPDGQVAEYLRVIVPFNVSRADVDTILKRAARVFRVPGGQVQRNGSETDKETGTLTWHYLLRGVWVRVVRTPGRTAFCVPPVHAEDAWVLATAVARVIATRFRFIPQVLPWPEPVEPEPAPPAPPRPWWRRVLRRP